MPQSIPREPPASARSTIPKRVTAAYLTALGLIALLATGAYFLLDDVAARQLDAARVTRLGGHQIMLLQRIGLLLADFEAGTVTARAPLVAAISELRSTEDTLADRAGRTPRGNLSPAARELFFSAPDPLDQAIRAFIDGARRFGDPATGNMEQAYRRLQADLHERLLPRLIASLSNFESETHRHIERLRTAQRALLAMLLVALVLQAMFIFRPLVVQTRHYAAHLYRLATSDDLTGLANRRHFMEIAARDFELARRSGRKIGVMVLDLDHFKKINDEQGHAIGDAVLRRFGEIATAMLRQSDMIARIGGDEFAILLPETDLEGATTVAEKLRRTIAEDRSGNGPPLTTCIGVAILRADDNSIDDLLRRADKALYQAKYDGRNRVALSPVAASIAMSARNPVAPSLSQPEMPENMARFEGQA
ncbi:MAG: diguanylate cyclase [Acetobacteraceae bacterium]